MKILFGKGEKFGIKIGTMMLCGVMLVPFNALAKEQYYYSNNNNVQFTEEQYNKYLGVYGEQKVANFTQEEFDVLTADYEIIKTEDKYFRTDYYLDKNEEVIDSDTQEVDESEFIQDQAGISPQVITSCPSYNKNCASVSSNYKKVTMEVEYGSSVSVTKVTISNVWTRIPTVKHLDLIGLKLSEANSSAAKPNYNGLYTAHQYWDGNTWSYEFDTTTNTIKKGNGIVQVMNIADDVKSSLSNDLTIYFLLDPIGVDFDATYQGCTSNSVTMSQVKTLSLSGYAETGYRVLGGTIKFKNPIGSYYDGTAGLHVSFKDPFVV